MKRAINPFDSTLLKVLFEIAIFFGISISGYYLRFYSNFIVVKYGIPSLSPYILLFVVETLLWLFIFQEMKLYRKHFFISLLDEWYSAFIALTLGTLIIFAFTFFYRTFTFSRILIIQNLFLVFIGIIIERSFLYKLSEKLYRKGYGSEHTVIIGGKLDELLERRVSHLKRLGYIVDEIIVDIEGRDLAKYNAIFWNIEELPFSLLKKMVEENKIKNSAKINLLGNFFAEFSSDFESFNIGGLPVLSTKRKKLNGLNVLFKRFFDILFSFIAIVLLLIPWTIIIIIVKITSNGPILYLQERITKGEKIFKIIKFRTMKVDAEDSTGPKWAEKNDNRKTKFGGFLRKTSLDETPQFINVFLGHMSIVGPRPERPVFVEKFMDEIPGYNLRHQVKTGITGWAQINGWRGNTSIKERTLFDLFYINNWSILFDIKIILRTVFELFFQKEAY
ncbi:exopolysaccharide biosynthesis polyprenyl glycosylphosphotransferase [bacterium]|nr:exopolysaccharide biosynthesis polyprenyl glycosylphosphotransferase [bacterium]